MKVTVVGGGSTYTPELVDGIARLGQLFAVDELVLTDPAEERLAVVAGVS
jgi:6-phospho-beta-glucosidase